MTTRKKSFRKDKRSTLLELIKGRLQLKSGGFGFVIAEDGDIFVAAENRNGAFDGEEVVVSILPERRRGGNREGVIREVVSQLPIQLVGTVDKSKNAMFVVCDDHTTEDIYIPKQKNGGARNFEKVVVSVVKRGDKNKSPEGEILEVLGKTGDKGVDILSFARRFGLVAAFSEEVEQEAANLEYRESDTKGRLDLRGETIFTIDGADAKDLDDAVSLEKLLNGNYKLGVHIADVSHYVRQYGEMDKEALKRATSVYLVDRVVPMLPEKLSNGLCSLNPHEDKLTLSCIMEINNDGEITGHTFAKSVINSVERMTYTNVNKILAEDPELSLQYAHIKDTLFLMNELAAILRENRFARGSIDFELEEPKIILDKEGVPLSIEPAQRGDGEKLIEEFMLAANITVAEQHYFMEMPFIYRIHETPDGDKMRELAIFLANFGIRLSGYQNIHPKAVQAVLNKAQGTEEHNIINRVTLRSLKKAKYDMMPVGHFGLAAERYCHFTSPIRRYPDLMVHRIIKTVLNGQATEKYIEKLEETLPDIAYQSSLRERNAVEAERAVQGRKMAEYMTQFIDQEFAGVVSGVTRFGVFVELPNTIEGMVPLSEMNDDYYVYFEKQYCVIGERTHKKISLGDKVKIRV
ncbi:MAG: ribonuclease R, partial [Eubacteriales bacterium]